MVRFWGNDFVFVALGMPNKVYCTFNLQDGEPIMYRQRGHTIHPLRAPNPSASSSNASTTSVSASVSADLTPDRSASASNSGSSSNRSSTLIVRMSNDKGHSQAYCPN